MDPDRDYVLIQVWLTPPQDGADTWPTDDVGQILDTIDRIGLELFGPDMPVVINFNTTGDSGVADDNDGAFDLDRALYGRPEGAQ